MERDRYRISLRIRHPTLTADAIRAALPLEPGHGWSVGAPRRTPKGQPLDGVFAETYCTFSLSEGDAAPAAAIAEAAERLASHRDLFHAIRAGGGGVEFFIGWFIAGGNSGDVFEPDLLARLGALGIGLSLDIYADDA